MSKKDKAAKVTEQFHEPAPTLKTSTVRLARVSHVSVPGRFPGTSTRHSITIEADFTANGREGEVYVRAIPNGAVVSDEDRARFREEMDALAKRIGALEQCAEKDMKAADV